MSKMKDEFIKQQNTGSIGGDEDYLYEQYLQQEQLAEQYWESVTAIENHSIFPDEVEYTDEYYKSTYIPTIEEQLELNELLKKQNGHT